MNRKTPVVFALVVTVMVVMADSPTAVLTLSGTVSRVVAITVTPQNNHNSLDLANGENDKVVGLVNEWSNDKAGYTIILTSAGAGSTSQPALKPSNAGNSDSVPYSLKYKGVPVQLNQGSAILSSGSGRTSSGGSNNFLTVTIPRPSAVAADSYSDTLTFTIQGN